MLIVHCLGLLDKSTPEEVGENESALSNRFLASAGSRFATGVMTSCRSSFGDVDGDFIIDFNNTREIRTHEYKR